MFLFRRLQINIGCIAGNREATIESSPHLRLRGDAGAGLCERREKMRASRRDFDRSTPSQTHRWP